MQESRNQSNALSVLCSCLEDRRHSLKTNEDVTYSLDSYSNGAVPAPRLIGHRPPLTESCTIIYTLLVPLCFLSHPKHALNSKVADNLHDWSAVMDGHKLFRRGSCPLAESAAGVWGAPPWDEQGIR